MKTSIDFYDKIAKKFGSYHRTSNRVMLQVRPNPEDLFSSRLLAVSEKNKIALDLGCADGQFTLEIADRFKRVKAVDLSVGMLQAAHAFLKHTDKRNVDFIHSNANNLPFAPETFDIVFSRRGPLPLKEAYRVLKPQGSFVLITIGERDCQDLKKLFKKGQGYGQWHKSVTQEIRYKSAKLGFKVRYLRNLCVNEFYPTLDDFSLFLEGVPIFEDFDPGQDRPLLEKYAQKFQSRYGIRLNRHRVVAELYKPIQK